MAGRPGPETRLIKRVKDKVAPEYGDRLVIIKYHGSGYSEGGVSDWLCCLDGVFIAAEWKAPENYSNSVEKAEERGATVKQKAFIQRVIAAGGVGGVVACEESFRKLLAEAEAIAKKRKKKGKGKTA